MLYLSFPKKHEMIRKHLLALLLVLLGFNFSVFGQDYDPRPRLDSLFEILSSENQIYGSVYILKEGKPFYQRSIQAGAENTGAGPLYRIGSISKTFTTVMVMKAMEAGKIKLEDPLSKWFPEIPSSKEITIEMMLAHRSGLHNFTNDAAFTAIMETEQSRESMLQRFAQMDLDFTPGAKMAYSNTNFVLLSYILEDLYKKPIAELLEDKITEPLKLEDTYFFEVEPRSEREIPSYYWTGEWVNAHNSHPSVPMGAGAIVSSPKELTEFMYALHHGELIKASSLEIMKSPEGTGLGLFRYPFYEREAFGHNGGIDGFVSHASYMPSEDLSVAICLNGTQYPMNDLLIDILSIYFNRADYTLPSFETIDIDKAQMLRYTGTYKSANFPLDIEVFLEDETLKARATGQDAFPLTALGEHVFEFKAAAIRMTFNPETGSMAFEQSGMKIPFQR